MRKCLLCPLVALTLWYVMFSVWHIVLQKLTVSHSAIAKSVHRERRTEEVNGLREWFLFGLFAWKLPKDVTLSGNSQKAKTRIDRKKKY